jgi:hypothetical protein
LGRLPTPGRDEIKQNISFALLKAIPVSTQSALPSAYTLCQPCRKYAVLL